MSALTLPERMITFGLIKLLRYTTYFTGATMPRFSGRKPFTQEIFNRHVEEMRNLLHALELRDMFEDNETRPKMDMYETCHDIVIEFDLPGFHSGCDLTENEWPDAGPRSLQAEGAE